MCKDGRERERHNLSKHESSISHRQAVQVSAALLPEQSARIAPEPSASTSSAHQVPVLDRTGQVIVEDGLRALVASVYDTSATLYPPDPFLNEQPTVSDPSPVTGILWGVSGETDQIGDSSIQEAARNVARATMDFLNNVNVSDDEVDERSEDEFEPGGDVDELGVLSLTVSVIKHS